MYVVTYNRTRMKFFSYAIQIFYTIYLSSVSFRILWIIPFLLMIKALAPTTENVILLIKSNGAARGGCSFVQFLSSLSQSKHIGRQVTNVYC